MFKVGQNLWFVSPLSHLTDCEVTVQKAGRVWATLDNFMRCDASGGVDGGGFTSPGHCYVNRDEYQLEQARQEAWSSFKRSLERKQMPESLTLEALEQIAGSLEI
jgi:hypothetical protein